MFGEVKDAACRLENRPGGVRPRGVRLTMATVHLIHGFIGSGKTTFARRLAARKNAVRISPDEWMVVLYGHNPPATEFPTYLQGIQKLGWRLCEQVVGTGTDVVLDYGFWTLESRRDARRRVTSYGAEQQFYSMRCDEATMLQRTLDRSRELPDDALFIDENAFRELFRNFEPMVSDERFIIVDGLSQTSEDL